jgi:hypothetical protein
VRLSVEEKERRERRKETSNVRIELLLKPRARKSRGKERKDEHAGRL